MIWRLLTWWFRINWRGPLTFASPDQTPLPGHRALRLTERVFP